MNRPAAGAVTSILSRAARSVTTYPRAPARPVGHAGTRQPQREAAQRQLRVDPVAARGGLDAREPDRVVEEPGGLVHDLARVAGEADAAARRIGGVVRTADVVHRDHAVPVARIRARVGAQACCAGARRRRSAGRRGTTPPSSPSAHVSHPLTAYHEPPTNTALLSPMPVATGELRSVTSGSLDAGDCEEPIRAGPRAAAGAPTPVRKRRMLRTSVRAWPRLAAPRRAWPTAAARRRSRRVPIWRSPRVARASTTRARSTRRRVTAQVAGAGGAQRAGEARGRRAGRPARPAADTRRPAARTRAFDSVICRNAVEKSDQSPARRGEVAAVRARAATPGARRPA